MNEFAIEDRKKFIFTKGVQQNILQCDSDSVSGSVSQRACVYSGARVVLNPITDAIHLVHGPIGCASYTWDIRGSLSSGSELYRNSFSTDLREKDVIFGGEPKLTRAIDDLAQKYHPKLIFVYSTCIVGVIGDDIGAVCRKQAQKHGIEIIPIQSSGFLGNKAAGYRAACEALLQLIGLPEPIDPPELIGPPEPVDLLPGRVPSRKPNTLNLLGDFNLAAETWIIQSYLDRIGVQLNVALTGDSTSANIKKAARASLNIVQCAGSMVYLAEKMEERFGLPYLRVSFIGVEDTIESLRKIAAYFDDRKISARTEALIGEEMSKTLPVLNHYRSKLAGRKAAVYVGGGYKAISLIKQFRELGMEVVMIGTQTGSSEDYRAIGELVEEGTVVLDDGNPAEMEEFMLGKGANLLVGGVKERPLAYKLGIAFVDHNHDRKIPLAGFTGAENFAREVYASLCSPVWQYLGKEGPA